MKLIAESGSTRTEWALVEDNRLIQRAFTEGLNPFFQTRREISRSVRLGLPEHFFKRKLEQVYYYGAGCTSYEKKNVLGASLVAQFKTPIQVESDLLAAARGLFKCEAGIACILGTGSNSCFYDGKIVVKNVRAGGYILGDEGSGAVLGKMFLSDVLKGLAPKDVTADFFEKFRISPNEVMESVYNRPFPNRFLSTISYFLADYTNDDYVFELITGNLRNFFTRNVCQYDYKNYPIRFVLFGSALLAGCYFLQNILMRRRLFFMTKIMGLSYLFIALWIMSIFGNYDPDTWYYISSVQLLPWALLFAVVAVICIYISLKTDDGMLRGFGLTFLGINLYTRFFEYFWNSLHSAIFFFILAISLIFIGRKAEKIWHAIENSRMVNKQ